MTIIQAEALSRIYQQGDRSIEVLKNVTLDVAEGETVAILGQSGSGKSTLLSLLAGLDRPTSGQVRLASRDIGTMSEKELAAFRAKNLGIVFQQFHLMSHLSALENVTLPLEIFEDRDAEQKAREALTKVGLAHRLEHLPGQLSGGEKQRVAIARAMVVQPRVLLADEPSGNLDTQTGDEVMELLFERVSSSRMAMILVTHNENLAKRCDRQYRLTSGALRLS